MRLPWCADLWLLRIYGANQRFTCSFPRVVLRGIYCYRIESTTRCSYNQGRTRAHQLGTYDQKTACCGQSYAGRRLVPIYWSGSPGYRLEALKDNLKYQKDSSMCVGVQVGFQTRRTPSLGPQIRSLQTLCFCWSGFRWCLPKCHRYSSTLHFGRHFHHDLWDRAHYHRGLSSRFRCVEIGLDYIVCTGLLFPL